MSLYEIPIASLDGKPDLLKDQQGHVTLMVNVASKCGLTPQYTGLEKIHEEYAPRGFSVVGFPCNQFLGQEPGHGEGDPGVLQHHVRRDVPAVGEDRRQR